MVLQIPNEWLTEIQQLFNEHLSEAELWAYGSRAQGKAHTGSDLDLMVKHHENMTVSGANLTAFREALRESNLPVMVDVLDYSNIPDDFRAKFKKDGIRLL